MAGEDEEKKKAAIDNFFKEAIEPTFKKAEKQLNDNGNDYIIGNQVIIYRSISIDSRLHIIRIRFS